MYSCVKKRKSITANVHHGVLAQAFHKYMCQPEIDTEYNQALLIQSTVITQSTKVMNQSAVFVVNRLFDQSLKTVRTMWM